MSGMQCAKGKLKVFHVTSPDKAEVIKREGIEASCHVPSAFADIMLELRRCSNYAWADLACEISKIIDDHPTDYPRPVVEVCVDENTPVYEMKRINDAQACVWSQEKAEAFLNNLSKKDMVTCMKKHSCEWKESAIPLKDYEKDRYEKPEVLIGSIPPSEVNVVPMVEAAISEDERRELADFIIAVNEYKKYEALEPEPLEPEPGEYKRAREQSEKEWQALLQKQWDKLKDVPHSDDVECTSEIMAWDWETAADSYREQSGIKKER